MSSPIDNSIAREALRTRLLTDLAADRVPHAIMFCGPQQAGKLAMALDFARALLCQHPQPDGQPCGQCISCRMAAKLEHPDLHFAFPIVKDAKTKTEDATSDIFIKEWRAQLIENPYFDLDQWLIVMGAENQQAKYYVAEAANIARKLVLKSNQGGRKVMLIWLPEKMNAETANALLKLFEEPPAGTHFIMVSDEPDLMLATILSRTQRILVPPMPDDEWRSVCPEKDEGQDFELFVRLMRLAYQRKAKELREWADEVSAMGRERQKQFLAFAQRMARENFIYNFQQPELNSLTTEQEAFSRNFARFVNERNIISFTDELQRAETDIVQNVNPRMVFFGLALQIIVLLKS